MDCQSGEIYDGGVIKQLIASGAIQDRSRFKQMEVDPTPAQMKRSPPRIGRNDACPCGSGKKFKRCCLRDQNDTQDSEMANE